MPRREDQDPMVLHRTPPLLHLAWAGPAIAAVLHAPKIASSGFSMICFTSGFAYASFFFV
jgi:hypothetical protein